MKKCCLWFLFVLTLIAATACDTVSGPRPSFELHSQNFNGGNPESWVTINPNGQTLQDIRIEWGRNSVETQPPVLYETSGLNQLESVEFIDVASNNNLNVSILQLSAPFRLYVKFGFTDLMEEDEVLYYKVRTTHYVENDQGDGDILYTWSEQFNIDYETFPTGEEPGPGSGSVNDIPCPDPIPVPTIVWPQDGDRCVGDVGYIDSEVATVEFRWEGVEGVDNMLQAYQVEIRRPNTDSCIDIWAIGDTGDYGVNPDCWVVDVNLPLWSENLPLNTTYEWSVRASCVLEGDDELTSGAFTAQQTFTTTTSIDCQNQ